MVAVSGMEELVLPRFESCLKCTKPYHRAKHWLGDAAWLTTRGRYSGGMNGKME